MKDYMTNTTGTQVEHFRRSNEGVFPGRVWFDQYHSNISRLSTAQDCPDDVLWMSVDEIDMILYMSVYSPDKFEYTFQVPRQGTTVEDVDTFIRDVEAHYSAKLPARIRTNAVTFVENMDAAATIRGTLMVEPEECFQCDEAASEVVASWFPEFVQGEGDYLYLWHKFDCHGEDTLSGSTAEVGQEVLHTLEGILLYMDAPVLKAQMKEFVTKLRSSMTV
jgi:hypothetical protein